MKLHSALRRLALMALAMGVLASTMAIFPAKTAAATPWTAPCTGLSCDGKDPHYYLGSTGHSCDEAMAGNAVQTIRSAQDSNWLLEMRFSWGCMSSWTRVTSWSAGYYYFGLWRGNGSSQEWRGVLPYQGRTYTRMLYDGYGYQTKSTGTYYPYGYPNCPCDNLATGWF